MGDVKLNHAGIAALLKSGEMHALVDGAAEEIAENVRSQGVYVEGVPGNVALPVVVSKSETTDRAHASVMIAHPSGIAVQAKHGALTRAAAAAGLSVS
jgi:6,7-dimethyl-8-ribityllumazine synthase